uniref:Uncharacterized protein n=1 Tax=Odontella aurita TaxID=265563 RepID=A0A7S4HZE5_9STRA|mmetsp:Transcript_17644/g.51355  ORF Transcript_17644/g.51355 Transcript_17644/m.51355 type:complete len:578 (+) Transcript_17644:204-1937(+)
MTLWTTITTMMNAITAKFTVSKHPNSALLAWLPQKKKSLATEETAADRAKTKAPARTAKKKPVSKRTDMQVRLLAPPTKFLYYIADPQVTLTMLDGDTILHLSAYLPLRSIGSLSCANKSMEHILSSDFLYCLGTGRSSTLPCVHQSKNVLPLRTVEGEARARGVARKFSIESSIYSCQGDESRARNFAVADHIRSKDAIDSILVHDGAVTYTTKGCEVITRWCGRKVKQSSLSLPICSYLISSAHHNGTRVYAVLASHSKGRCRYVLSLVTLSRKRDGAPTLLWEHQFSAMLFTSSATKAVVKFNLDGSRILFGTLERCFVIDAASGKNVWAMRRANLLSVVIQDKFVFAVTQSRSLHIYNVTQGQDPVASGTLPRRLNSELNVQGIIFLGGRVWIVCETKLMCTGRLMRVLRNLASSAAGEGIPRVTVMDVSYLEPQQKHIVHCHDNFLYVASGKRIRGFDRRNIFAPCKTYCAEEKVNAMQIDQTKIICATVHPNGRSGRLEIIPICQVGGLAYPSVFVKRTFLSSHQMYSIQFGGRLLVVLYRYDVVEDRSCSGEIQVFDIQHCNDYFEKEKK